LFAPRSIRTATTMGHVPTRRCMGTRGLAPPCAQGLSRFAVAWERRRAARAGRGLEAPTYRARRLTHSKLWGSPPHGNRTRKHHRVGSNSWLSLEAEKRRTVFRTAVGEFAPTAQTAFGMERVVTQGGEHELANGRQIACGMALAHAAVVFQELRRLRKRLPCIQGMIRQDGVQVRRRLSP
jgi:hypothetical protein